MTRAILRDDVIIKITCDEKLGVEIGKIPKGVGVPRLRFDGKKLIDLFSLQEFYINRETKQLHVIKLPNCDIVTMEYKDRKNLIIDKETNKLRVKTQIELEQPKKDEYKARRRAEYPSLGDQVGAIMEYLKTKKDIPDELKSFVDNIDAVKDKWSKTD